MADTFTTDGVGLILMTPGGDNNIWGANLNNSALQPIADALSNQLSTAVTGGTLDLSGSPPPAASSQARYSAIVFNGALASNQIVVVPNLAKWWWVVNGTSGAFSFTMQLPGAVSPIVIPQTGDAYLVRANGAGVLILTALGLAHLIPGDGSVSVPSYSFINEQNTGWRRAGTQDVRLTINGVDVLQVTGTGAASPSVVNILSPQTLEVAGAPAGFFTTGDVKLTFKTVADPGWVLMNDSTIGNATSNSTYANANCSALFQLLYNNISDADAPLLTSGGAGTTRGAQGSAATAFANSVRLTLPLVLGRALAGAGNGAGLTARPLGHAGGEEAHTLAATEIPGHTHGFSATTSGESQGHTHTFSGTDTGRGLDSGFDKLLRWLGAAGNFIGGNTFNPQVTTVVAPSGVSGTFGLVAPTVSPTISGTTSNVNQDHTHGVSGTTDGGSGGGQGHNTIQPTNYLTVMIKL
jgi:microcystin-dependent protein